MRRISVILDVTVVALLIATLVACSGEPSASVATGAPEPVGEAEQADSDVLPDDDAAAPVNDENTTDDDGADDDAADDAADDDNAADDATVDENAAGDAMVDDDAADDDTADDDIAPGDDNSGTPEINPNPLSDFAGDPARPGVGGLVGCGDVSSIDAESPWPMWGGCPANRFQFGASVGDRPLVALARLPVSGMLPSDAPGGTGYIFAALPVETVVASDGTIYTIVERVVGYQSVTYLVSLAPDLAIRWQVQIPAPPISGPFVLANGKVFVFLHGLEAIAYEPDGQIAWDVRPEGVTKQDTDSFAVPVSMQRILMSTQPRKQGTGRNEAFLYDLDGSELASGDLWHTSTTFPAVHPIEPTVFVADFYAGGLMYAYALPAFSELWSLREYRPGDGSLWNFSPTHLGVRFLSDGTVLGVNLSGDSEGLVFDSGIVAVGSDGGIQWTTLEHKGLTLTALAVGKNDDLVTVDDGVVTGVDPHGNRVWAFPDGTSNTEFSGALPASELLVDAVVDRDGRTIFFSERTDSQGAEETLVVLNRDGTIAWTISTAELGVADCHNSAAMVVADSRLLLRCGVEGDFIAILLGLAPDAIP